MKRESQKTMFTNLFMMRLRFFAYGKCSEYPESNAKWISTTRIPYLDDRLNRALFDRRITPVTLDLVVFRGSGLASEEHGGFLFFRVG